MYETVEAFPLEESITQKLNYCEALHQGFWQPVFDSLHSGEWNSTQHSSGLVVIIDGHDIMHSNFADLPDGNPVSIENLKVHFCEKGNGYMIRERKFLPEATEGAVIKKQVDVE